MTRITNLFFLYFLACMGYGFADVYFESRSASYFFLAVGFVISLLTLRSEKYRSKEAHEFYRKQVFWTNLISIICFLVGLRTKAFIAFHVGILVAAFVAFVFWLSTLFYRKDDDENQLRMRRTRRGNHPPIA